MALVVILISILKRSSAIKEKKSDENYWVAGLNSSKLLCVICRNPDIFPQCDKMIMVACGWQHTISISSSGGLYTYGWSKYGQLGHGDFEDYLMPHKLQALSDKLICQFRSHVGGDTQLLLLKEKTYILKEEAHLSSLPWVVQLWRLD